MNNKRVLWMLIIVGLSVVLAACGGGEVAPEEAVDPDATPTPSPADEFPEVIPIHPEAFDLEANTTADTYIYHMPGMVEEAVDYFIPEMETLGWEPMGNPTIMGHLATFNMEGQEYRMAVSMQDNENRQTTRIQMTLSPK
jgi:hypothetical protein